MWIKLDGENIVGHDYYQHDDYNIKIDIDIIVDLSGEYIGVYKYKYVGGQLVELSDNEKKNHPLYIKDKMNKKLNKIYDKLLRKNNWLAVRAANGIKPEEIIAIDTIIAAIDAEPVE